MIVPRKVLGTRGKNQALRRKCDSHEKRPTRELCWNAGPPPVWVIGREVLYGWARMNERERQRQRKKTLLPRVGVDAKKKKGRQRAQCQSELAGASRHMESGSAEETKRLQLTEEPRWTSFGATKQGEPIELVKGKRL